jgi:hypothetical protein
MGLRDALGVALSRGSLGVLSLVKTHPPWAVAARPSRCSLLAVGILDTQPQSAS